MVARGWGGDRVPPRWKPGDQDAGDHQGPPHRPSSTLAPTEYPPPFREGDAYYSRLIGPHKHHPQSRIQAGGRAIRRGEGGGEWMGGP